MIISLIADNLFAEKRISTQERNPGIYKSTKTNQISEEEMKKLAAKHGIKLNDSAKFVPGNKEVKVSVPKTPQENRSPEYGPDGGKIKRK